MDGQITITEWLQSKIKDRAVKDLTEWINTQGRSQYGQVKAVIRKNGCLESNYQIDRLTNDISVYILQMSTGYMNYLKSEGAEDIKFDFETFRDYCKHQSGSIKFGDDEEASRGCTFKDERSATCWDDWQKCNEQNCPFMKKMKGKL